MTDKTMTDPVAKALEMVAEACDKASTKQAVEIGCRSEALDQLRDALKIDLRESARSAGAGKASGHHSSCICVICEAQRKSETPPGPAVPESGRVGDEAGRMRVRAEKSESGPVVQDGASPTPAPSPGMRLATVEEMAAADKPCTCHPDDNPPRPCPQKYALTECRAAVTPSLSMDAPDRVDMTNDQPTRFIIGNIISRSIWSMGFDGNLPEDYLRQVCNAADEILKRFTNPRREASGTAREAPSQARDSVRSSPSPSAPQGELRATEHELKLASDFIVLAVKNPAGVIDLVMSLTRRTPSLSLGETAQAVVDAAAKLKTVNANFYEYEHVGRAEWQALQAALARLHSAAGQP